MAQFRVGQRVRIKWSIGWPELAGQEGRIEGVCRITVGPSVGDFGFSVAPDSWGSPLAPRKGRNGGTRFAALHEQLEPLTDDRNQVIPWEKCCVGPDGVWREGVAA